jgi:competence protein ComEC
MGRAVEQAPQLMVAPLVPLALALAVGIVADRFISPWGTSTWGTIALLATLAAAAGLWRLRVAGMLAALLIALALGGGWHHACWSDLAGDDLAWSVSEQPRPVWVRGVLRDVLGVHPGDPGLTRAILDITMIRGGTAWRGVGGRALLVIVGARGDLVAGEAVETAGSLERLAGPLNPGEFDARAYHRAQAIRLRLTVDDPHGVWRDRSALSLGLVGMRWRGIARGWSRARLVAGLDAGVAPLAAALLLGQREGVDPDVNDAFARTGTTHLLAISGLHLQVLGFVLLVVFRALGLGRRGCFAAVSLATVAYALLVGLVPSVVRSAAMTVIACMAGMFDRSVRPANTLALAALVTLGLNPSYLFDVGCQLSFLAIAAIVWGSSPLFAWWGAPATPLDRLERALEPRWRRRLRGASHWLAQMVAVSLVVWLITLPLVALRFHMVAPIGIALNIPLIPLTTAALLASGLTLGLSALWAPLAVPAAWATNLFLRWTDSLVRWGAKLPGGHLFVPAPSWVWVLGIYLLLALATAAQVARRPTLERRGAWGILAAWLALGIGLGLARLPHQHSVLEAEVLAVGHGLAVVVTTSDGRTWVYDCGRMRDPSVGRRIIAPALWARGIRHIDAVILSHADSDHYNGLLDLLDRFSIGVVRVPPGFAGPANPGTGALLDTVRGRGVPVRSIAAGDHWEAAGARFSVWHPPSNAALAPALVGASDNARSVVLDLEAEGHHVVLTGDLEGPGLDAFSRRPLPPVDVLLAPHHGGRTANPTWLYEWAEPRLVVVSQRQPTAGSKDALAWLDQQHLLLRTWARGAIRLKWTKNGVVALGFRDHQARWDDL